jgi:Mn2+/Fe2+ NRAMP family transporter
VAITASGGFPALGTFHAPVRGGQFPGIPLAIFSHPRFNPVLHGLVVPGIAGGANSTSVLLIIEIVGTTVAPWQLFFQQSNIVDKRITPRWINYERADTVLGAFVTVLAATAMVATSALAFAHTHYLGLFTDAGGVARGLAHRLGPTAGTLYAIILLNASITGAAAVTLGTSYAFGNFSGARHSLHRNLFQAKGHYASFDGIMSLILVATTVFPNVDVGALSVALAAALLVALGAAGAFFAVRRPSVGGATAAAAAPRSYRDSWRMPPITLLGRPAWSRGRLVGMWARRAYLVVAVLLLLVKAVQLGQGH